MTKLYIKLSFFSFFYRGLHGKSRPKKKLKTCPYCNKQMMKTREHILREHEKRTPFPCNQCSKSYTSQGELNGHLKRVHQRVKCEECGQEICNLFMLKRHKAKAHGMKPENVLQCHHCPIFFYTKGHFDRHMAKVHPGKVLVVQVPKVQA